MTSNAFFTIPIPVPVDADASLTLADTLDELQPRDDVEKTVLAEIDARNHARREAMLPLVDVAKEFLHFRENRELIEYSRWLRANVTLFDRLEKKFYSRWVAANPTKTDFYVPAQLEAHRVMGWLFERDRRRERSRT